MIAPCVPFILLYSIPGKAELDIKREYSERCAIVCEAIRQSYNTGQIVSLKK